LLFKARAHSSSPRRIPLFERASARWWNPQFASPTLETQYWKCSFPLLRDRFRSGLIYILICCLSWMLFLWLFDQAHGHHWASFNNHSIFSFFANAILTNKNPQQNSLCNQYFY
jgi:hypothetical protein